MTKQKTLFILILFVFVYIMTLNSAQGILVSKNSSEEIISSNDKQYIRNNTFELGQWSVPIFITNILLSIIGVLYYKKKLPLILLRWVNLFRNFEVSNKVSWIIVISLLGIFIGFSVDKFQNPEELGWVDYGGVEETAKNFNFNSIDVFGRYFLPAISLHIFGNIRVVAFIESISLIVTTYLLTAIITKKRFAGIIAIIILIQSSLFLKYSVTATYDNSWTLCYVLSLYLIYKKWPLSPISYIFSIFYKQITFLFIPLTFFFIYRAPIKNKKKLAVSYLVVLSFVLVYLFEIYKLSIASFSLDSFLTGFLAFGKFLKYDGFVTIFLLPLVVALFLLSRKGFMQADSVMLLIGGVIFSGMLLQGFVEFQNEPYRYIPLVVFFAIGTGVLVSDKKTQLIQQGKNHLSYISFGFTLIMIIFSLLLTIFPSLMHGTYRLTL